MVKLKSIPNENWDKIEMKASWGDLAKKIIDSKEKLFTSVDSYHHVSWSTTWDIGVVGTNSVMLERFKNFANGDSLVNVVGQVIATPSLYSEISVKVSDLNTNDSFIYSEANPDYNINYNRFVLDWRKLDGSNDGYQNYFLLAPIQNALQTGKILDENGKFQSEAAFQFLKDILDDANDEVDINENKEESVDYSNLPNELAEKLGLPEFSEKWKDEIDKLKSRPTQEKLDQELAEKQKEIEAKQEELDKWTNKFPNKSPDEAESDYNSEKQSREKLEQELAKLNQDKRELEMKLESLENNYQLSQAEVEKLKDEIEQFEKRDQISVYLNNQENIKQLISQLEGKVWLTTPEQKDQIVSEWQQGKYEFTLLPYQLADKSWVVLLFSPNNIEQTIDDEVFIYGSQENTKAKCEEVIKELIPYLETVSDSFRDKEDPEDLSFYSYKHAFASLDNGNDEVTSFVYKEAIIEKLLWSLLKNKSDFLPKLTYQIRDNYQKWQGHRIRINKDNAEEMTYFNSLLDSYKAYLEPGLPAPRWAELKEGIAESKEYLATYSAILQDKISENEEITKITTDEQSQQVLQQENEKNQEQIAVIEQFIGKYK